MVLDPITAVGIAANVVQFVDFGFKLVSNGVELYRNSTLLEHAQLRDQAQRLQDFNSILTDRYVQLGGEKRHDDLLKDQESLRIDEEDPDSRDSPEPLLILLKAAVEHCDQCAAQLLEAVSTLTVSGPRRKWQSFRHALSSVIGDSGLATANKRLSEAQQNVTLFLILYTSSKEVDTSRIVRSSNDTEKLILNAVNKSTDGLSQQIESLRESLHNAKSSTVDGIASESCKRQPRLFDRVQANVNRTLPYMARDKFLETLHFDTLDDRHDSIATAHKQTLQWVLTPGSHQGVSWHDFPSWLRCSSTSNNIYWVTGKPGSGKSTLMRYLADSEQTQTLLQPWAGPRSVRLLRCFFWNPGNMMQKLMEGLLRSLLYQALSDQDVADEEFQEIAPERWHDLMYDLKPIQDWTVSDLSLALRNALSVLSKQSNLAVFVDGLDEFGIDRAEREDLVNLFLGMLDVSNLKMCLSSRPWNEFSDTLGKFPRLRLEELTRGDMRAFVQAELGNSRAVQDLAQVASDEVSELQQQLTAKSAGVFLWLHLVTRRLKIAAQDGCSLRKLCEMLDHIPPDLDDFFHDMLRRIPERDRVQTSRIFQIIVDGRLESLPDLMTLSFTDEDVLDFALTHAVESERRAQILSRIIAFKRRSNSQCMDLLVCGSKRPESGYKWENTPVEYLHRTVKDFLESGVSRKLLLDYTDGVFDTSRYLCNAFLAQIIFMKQLTRKSRWATEENYVIEIGLFESCTRTFGYILPKDSRSAKPLFERAVDEVDPVLQARTSTISSPALERYTENKVFSTTMHSILVTYQRTCHDVQHTYLLMSTLSGFDELAKVYAREIPADTDVSAYTVSLAAGARYAGHPTDFDLFTSIMERAAKFRTVEKLSLQMELFSRELHETPVAGFMRILLDKSVGTIYMPDRIDVVMEQIRKSILLTHGPPASTELLSKLQTVRKTWIPLSRTSPVKPTNQSRLSSKVRGIFSSKTIA